MMGLPLRLLAREVYDRVTARVGEGRVALMTGEEKRLPPHPDYWICTVEAMPTDRPVDFLAVDEIQLAAHRERGHVFTDRLLHARGRRETWFLGADTMRPMVQSLIPACVGEARHPRCPSFATPGAAPSRAFLRARPWSPSPRTACTSSPRRCAASGAGWRSSWERSPRGRAMRRWPCTRPGRCSTSWPPMPSAWDSTSTSTTWPSRRSPSTTAPSSATSSRTSWPRSRAARDAT